MTEAADRSPAPPFSPTMAMILQARELEARVEAELGTLGLSLRRFGLLGHLDREPGISFSALARRAGIKVQSLHPITDALVADGYVVTVGGVGQGKAAVLELTPTGSDVLDRAKKLVEALDRDLFAAPEWAALSAALRGIFPSLRYR